MNWYKQSKIENSRISKVIKQLLLYGLSSVAIISFVVYNFKLSKEEASFMLNQVLSSENITVDNITNAEDSDKKLFNIDEAHKEPVKNNNFINSNNYESVEDSIKRHENFSPFSYQDTKKNRSIGYGFNLNNSDSRRIIESLGLDYDSVYAGRQQITKDQADRLFQHSMENARNIAASFASNFNSLPIEIQNVLINMSYNLGSRLFQFKKMKKAVEEMNWKEMAIEMIDSKWYNQVGNRSKELVNIVENQR